MAGRVLISAVEDGGSNMREQVTVKDGRYSKKNNVCVNSTRKQDQQVNVEGPARSTNDNQPKISIANENNINSKLSSKSTKNAWGNCSYADLITKAIMSSPDKKMTLQEIYSWISHNIPYFMDKKDGPTTTGWKNSVRHTLSLRKRFKRIHNFEYGSLNYKSYWMVDQREQPRTPSRVSGQTNHVEQQNTQANKISNLWSSNGLLYTTENIKTPRFFCPYCNSYRRLNVPLPYQPGYYGYN